MMTMMMMMMMITVVAMMTTTMMLQVLPLVASAIVVGAGLGVAGVRGGHGDGVVMVVRVVLAC